LHEINYIFGVACVDQAATKDSRNYQS